MFCVLPSFQKESFLPVTFHFSLDRACFHSAICYKLTILESGTGATLPSVPHFSTSCSGICPQLVTGERTEARGMCGKTAAWGCLLARDGPVASPWLTCPVHHPKSLLDRDAPACHNPDMACYCITSSTLKTDDKFRHRQHTSYSGGEDDIVILLIRLYSDKVCLFHHWVFTSQPSA